MLEKSGPALRLSHGMIQDLMNCGKLQADRLEFSAGQVVFQPEDPATRFFLVESGEVRIFHVVADEISRLLDILGPDEWLGLAVLAQVPTYEKRAIARTDSVLLALPLESLHYALIQHADLALELIQSMARRLREAWNESSQLVSEDCRLRLIRTLLRFSTSPAATPSGGGISLHMTHAQLAQAVGAARETVSVCLNELRQTKMIRTGRNQVFFNPDQLREMECR